MTPAHELRLSLPDWCVRLTASLPDRLPDADARMELAIELSRRNVDAGTGGPFGAVVCDAAGSVLAVGVNRVEAENCSSAHAEIVALGLAQRTLACWNLAETPGAPVELATSCEPCAMCLGAIPWSGVARVLCGASKRDAELTGFDEGERPADWIDVLARRGIRVRTGLRRDEAAAVLRDYRERGAPIYNP